MPVAAIKIGSFPRRELLNSKGAIGLPRTKESHAKNAHTPMAALQQAVQVPAPCFLAKKVINLTLMNAQTVQLAQK